MNTSAEASTKLLHWGLVVIVAAALWVAAYTNLTPMANALLSVFGLTRKTHFGEAIHFFLYDTPKVLLLLTGICLLYTSRCV